LIFSCSFPTFFFSYQVLLDDSILSKKDESKMNKKSFLKKFLKRD